MSGQLNYARCVCVAVSVVGVLAGECGGETGLVQTLVGRVQGLGQNQVSFRGWAEFVFPENDS